MEAFGTRSRALSSRRRLAFSAANQHVSTIQLARMFLSVITRGFSSRRLFTRIRLRANKAPRFFRVNTHQNELRFCTVTKELLCFPRPRLRLTKLVENSREGGRILSITIFWLSSLKK